MSDYVQPATNISQAWLNTLELVHACGGRRTNVLTTVRDPLAVEDHDIRITLDGVLVPGTRNGVSIKSIETVANTIFPQDLYVDPQFMWSPDLTEGEEAELDTAASDLYQMYSGMLPLLCTADGSAHGTYFGRMVSWPGKDANGVNQLADRVKYLRGQNKAGKSTYNLSDITIGGQAETDTGAAARLGDAIGDLGLQVYASTDRRQRGFPCLVHIDFTLLDGKLSMLAVYRHQYLVSKAYGNLLGLARLLGFVAQQSGFMVGELAVLATLADCETATFGGMQGIKRLIEQARSVAVNG